MTILTQVFGSILSVRQNSEAVSSLAQDSRYILLKLPYDVKRATAITAPLAGLTSDSISMSIGGQNHVYSLSDGALTLAIDGGSPARLNSIATIVTSLSFSRNTDLGGDVNISLDITLEARQQVPGSESNSRNIRTTIATR